MIDGRNPQPTPDAPVPLDLAAITHALASIETSVSDDPDRSALLSDLETLVCAATGAQAAVAVDLERSQIAARAAAGVPKAHRGRGIAEHVGLARRESGHRGVALLGLARTVMGDLPHVAAVWRAGLISQHRVRLIVTQASCLDAPERRKLDARIAGTPELVEDLRWLGDRQVENTAAQIAYELDKKAVIARRQKAVGDRHTKLRRAPDGMGWFSALVPLKDGIAMHQSLAAAATTARNADDNGDDDRTFGQVMADTLVDRVTGRTDETPIPVHVEIVVPVDVATGEGAHADGECWAPAYGPVPADVAREWAEDAETYTRIWADAPTGQVIGTESTSQARIYPPGLAKHARRRDRICRIPYCNAPVKHTDHTVDAASGGQTSIQNAGGLCEQHNYAKQGHGWSATTNTDPNGTHVITYRTPTGESYESRPPPAYPPRE